MFMVIKREGATVIAGARTGWSLKDAGGHLCAASVTHAGRMQLGIRPCLGKQPGGVGGAAEVEAAVDQDAGNPGEPVGVPENLVVGEPGVVAEVVGDDPRERHPEGRIVIAGVRLPSLLVGQQLVV